MTGGGNGVGVAEGGAGQTITDVGRDRKRSEQDGNFIFTHGSHMTATSSPATSSGSVSDVGSSELKNVQSINTPGQAQHQRVNTQSEKPFSYAQALKTKSSPYSKLPEGTSYRPPSSKLSSRSQTPSESSLLGGGGKDLIKGVTHGPAGMSGSPVLGYRQDKGAGLSLEDSVDFDLRSNSALSVASVTSDRSASRQSINIPLDAPQQVDDAQESKPVGGGRRDEDDTEALLTEPNVQHKRCDLPESSSHIPPSPLLPVPPTKQMRPPSPSVTSSSTVTLTTVYSPQSVRTEFTEHQAVPVAHTSAPSTPAQPSQHLIHEEGGMFASRDRGSHSPPPPPPPLSESKEIYHSPGAPATSLAESPTASAQVFDTLQSLEQAPPMAPPTTVLPNRDELDSAEKSKSMQEASALMSGGQKPSEAKGGHDLMLTLPLRSREGVLPSPPIPTMSSILPHPPGGQMGFATQPGQSQLPLRPPGE